MAAAAPTWPIDVQRMLRVNQSGEFGAIGIYQAQRLLAPLVWRDGRELIDAMLAHEREHLRVFTDLLRRRGIRSCYAIGLWRVGGWMLGFVTGLFGRRGILVCTESVETTVLEHLDEQKRLLDGRDAELIAAIEMIEVQERDHRDHGVAAATEASLPLRAIRVSARYATEFAIALSMRF